MKEPSRVALRHRALACALAVATACAAPTERQETDAPAPGPVVARVEIVAPATVLAVGGSVTFKATAFDSSGNALSDRVVAWTSSSTGIARVTTAGTVEGVAAGSATITATVGGRSASVSVSVRSIGAVTRVVVTPGRLHLLPFGDDTLRATAYDANGFIVPGRSVTWSIPDNTIAKISATGIVTGVATGTVRVTALVDGQTGSGDVVVVATFGPAVSQVHVSPGGQWGRETACAVTQSGVASCWGDNTFGQLGDGTKTSRERPVAVAGGVAFRTIRPGGMHTCGLTPAGAAYCWGSNSSGALGDGTTTERLTPTPVTGGHQFTQLVVGEQHACGLDGDGKVWCWGSNRAGQLGVGSATPSSAVPVMVLATVRFETLSTHYTHWMGDHYGAAICAMSVGGTLWCWGEALPDGVKAIRYTPTDVGAPTGLRQVVDGGYEYSGGYTQQVLYCGLDAQGAVWCAAGRGPLSSTSSTGWRRELGPGTALSLLPPGGVSRSLCGMVDVSGTVRCWQLASSTLAARPLSDQPLLVSGSATGSPTVYGIDTARRLWRWTSLSANAAALSGPVLVVLPTP